jgi:hypothetical protein
MPAQPRFIHGMSRYAAHARSDLPLPHQVMNSLSGQVFRQNLEIGRRGKRDGLRRSGDHSGLRSLSHSGNQTGYRDQESRESRRRSSGVPHGW